jgi:hypothetical protein
VGGIEDSKQFSKILREEKKAHKQNCKNTPKIEQSFHAAEIPHFYQEQFTTRQTSTSTSFVDVTNGSISSASFVTDAKYLISVTAQLDGSSAAVNTAAQTLHGTTAFTDSVWSNQTNTATTNKILYAWWTVWTAVSGEGIKLQFKNQAAATAGIDNVTLVAIKISDLTENTDWKYQEVNAVTALVTTGDSTANNAIVTVIPTTAGHDWLCLTKSRITGTNIAASTGSRIVRSGEASSTGPFVQVEGEDATNDSQVYTLARVFNLGAASNTFTEKGFAAQSNNGNRQTSAVFILNLNKFRNHANAYSDASVTALSTTAYATQASTASITPSVTGDVWAYAFMTFDSNSAGNNFKARMQIDNVDQPGGANAQTGDNYILQTSWDVTDELPFNIQTIDSLTSGSAHPVDLDASESATTGTPGARAKGVFAVTMELPPPNALIKTPTTESVGIAEAVSRLTAYKRIPTTDTLTITETPTKLTTKIRRPTTDTVGITETTVKVRIRKVSENVTLTETVRRPRVMLRETSVILDIDEFLSTRHEDVLIDDITENVAITETLTRFKKIIRTEYDDLDYSGADYSSADFAAAHLIVISETVRAVRGLIKAVNESLIITELATRLTSRTKVLPIENVGITESFATATISAQALKKVVDESVGITEDPTRLEAITRKIDEQIALTETPTRLKSLVRQLSEQVGITETTPELQGIIRVLDETLAVTEIIQAVLSRQLTKETLENISLTESLVEISGLIRVVGGKTGVGFTEEGFLSEGFTNVSSAIGASTPDYVSDDYDSNDYWEQTIPEFEPAITISETVSALLKFEKPILTETVQITETVSALLTTITFPPGPPPHIPPPRPPRPHRYPQRLYVPEREEKPVKEPEILELRTPVVSKCKFRYDIEDAKIWQEKKEIEDKLEALRIKNSTLQQIDYEHPKTKPSQKSTEPQTPVPTPITTARTIESELGQPETEKQHETYKSFNATLKLKYDIQNTVNATLSARYSIKDGRLYQKLLKYASILHTIDLMDEMEELEGEEKGELRIIS